MTQPTPPLRPLPNVYGPDGTPTYGGVYSSPDYKVRGLAVVAHDKAIPVIFLPGIMGTVICNAASNSPVWDPPNSNMSALGKVMRNSVKMPRTRQAELNPATTRVYEDGPITLSTARLNQTEARRRGWARLHQQSYSAILNLLEDRLNEVVLPPWMLDAMRDAQKPVPKGNATSPHAKLFAPSDFYLHWQKLQDAKASDLGLPAESFSRLTEAEINKVAGYHFPVYAFGYNWLANNQIGAEQLQKFIQATLEHHRKLGQQAEKVILVTHSMGGLVARECARKYDPEKRILGIVHGVMPSIGAGAAYRRVRAGLERKQFTDHLAAQIIGPAADHVTPVFANAIGPLQLLPTHDYPKGWLRATTSTRSRGSDTPRVDTLLELPKANPYKEIYSERNRWYRLVDPALIDPANLHSRPWDEYVINLRAAEEFHKALSGQYHSLTYAYYGDDAKQMAYGEVRWECPQPMSDNVRTDFHRAQIGEPLVVMSGDGVTVIPGDNLQGALNLEVPQRFRERFSLNNPDRSGDGTVPGVSGQQPGKYGVKLSRLSGFDHQGSYGNEVAQSFTMYAIAKITQHVPY